MFPRVNEIGEYQGKEGDDGALRRLYPHFVRSGYKDASVDVEGWGRVEGGLGVGCIFCVFTCNIVSFLEYI